MYCIFQQQLIHFTFKLKSYLYSTAYNLFIDGYRKQKNRLTFLDNLKHEALQDEVQRDEVEFQQKIAAIDDAIEKLPEKCRLIFIMHKKQGYSYREIAKKLELSIKTVEAQMGIALKKIRKKIDY